MNGETRKVHISRVDPELKARLVAEAEAKETSLNELVAGIFAERFGVRFIGTGRRGPGADHTKDKLNVPVPESLYRKIDAAVDRQPKGRRTLVALADDIFRAYFDAVDAAAAT